MLETFEDTLGTTVTTVTNETVTPTDTGVFVAFNSTTADVFCYNAFTITLVTNATGSQTLTAGNYTGEASTGRIINLSLVDGEADWNVSYTYSHDDGSACEGLNDTITATSTIPTWLTIIVLVLIVGILLYLVFKAVPAFSSEGATGAEGAIAQV